MVIDIVAQASVAESLVKSSLPAASRSLEVDLKLLCAHCFEGEGVLLSRDPMMARASLAEEPKVGPLWRVIPPCLWELYTACFGSS